MTESISSCNGQLIYRETCFGIEPDRRNEIFIGRVPRDCRLKESLLPLFKKVGRLLELRMLVSFSGHCRGFAFAIYATKREAEIAIQRLNNYEISNGWYLGLCWSINKCKISLTNIPADVDFQSIAEFIYGVSEVSGPGEEPLYVVYSAGSGCRGASVIWEHKTHRSAALNRKNITGPAAIRYGPQTQVTWVEPGRRILEDEYPLMATRKNKFSPIVIEPTDVRLVNIFETNGEGRDRRQVRKEPASNESSALLRRRNGPNLSISRPLSDGDIDLQLDWQSLPDRVLSLFKEITPATSSPLQSEPNNYDTSALSETSPKNIISPAYSNPISTPITPASSGYGSYDERSTRMFQRSQQGFFQFSPTQHSAYENFPVSHSDKIHESALSSRALPFDIPETPELNVNSDARARPQDIKQTDSTFYNWFLGDSIWK